MAKIVIETYQVTFSRLVSDEEYYKNYHDTEMGNEYGDGVATLLKDFADDCGGVIMEINRPASLKPIKDSPKLTAKSTGKKLA